jgi:hypothetical protein
MNLKVEDLEGASTEFHFVYGCVLAAWGNVERGLFFWFAALTGMREDMARAIFYSSRSFNGRAEMLEAAISVREQRAERAEKHNETPEKAGPKPIDIQLIKQALRRAWKYSEFRNSVTHGEATLTITKIEEPDKATISYDVMHGRNWGADDDRAISITQMMIASDNFDALHTILIESCPRFRKKVSATLEQFLSRVQALPKMADSQSNPIPPEPGGQPQPEMSETELRARFVSRHSRLGSPVRVRTTKKS